MNSEHAGSAGPGTNAGVGADVAAPTRLSLAAAIRRRLAIEPERVIARYLARGEEETAALSGGEIEDSARRVAGGLISAGLPGQRVLLVMETGPDFLYAITGCLYAGVVAIPASEPRAGASLDRLEEIAANSGAAAVLVSTRVADALARRVRPNSPLAGLPLLDVASLAATSAAATCPGLDADPEAPVIVQYTSGSTGAPRGVVLDSACILANIAMSSRGMDVGQRGEAERLVNWMPHYHDMGLVGKILTPLVNGLEVIHMSPLAFAQRPARWLQAISRYRATTSGAPAFALDLCTSRVPDDVVDTLDLSSWRTAFCGAEPVFAATLSEFRRRFARAGLQPEAVFTCYGLAETTLYAAGAHGAESPDEEAPPGARAPCHLDQASRAAIRIVDEQGRVLPDGAEGEIWIAGPSLAAGYFGDPGASRRTFGARTVPDDGRDYLRSGDLGRVQGDALTITGRIKDVLISAGLNVSASDVERFATRSQTQLNPDGAAAFQLPEEEGGALVLVMERQRGGSAQLDEAEAVRAIRAAVFAALGISLDTIRIVRPGTLPRTTSGKIRRAVARAAWIAGDTPLAEAS
ncbi:MAG TPA: fatty acyl-AMP ligase [Allosphingosinicella sp.]